jgi:hypothetical protein
VTARNVFAFIIWEKAAPQRARILDDLGRHFTVLAVVDVEWTGEAFASNLARLYGDRLPSAAEKADRCGTGPFTLVVVGNTRPAYRLRRARRRLKRVNSDVFAARERYRRLTRSHDFVHATLDDDEASRDIYLVTGRERASYAERSGAAESLRADLLGTHGWTDEAQLKRALELAGGCRELEPDWVLEVGDPWWAARLAFVSDDPPLEGPVLVAGRERALRLVPSPASRRPLGLRLPRLPRRLPRTPGRGGS